MATNSVNCFIYRCLRQSTLGLQYSPSRQIFVGMYQWQLQRELPLRFPCNYFARHTDWHHSELLRVILSVCSACTRAVFEAGSNAPLLFSCVSYLAVNDCRGNGRQAKSGLQFKILDRALELFSGISLWTNQTWKQLQFWGIMFFLRTPSRCLFLAASKHSPHLSYSTCVLLSSTIDHQRPRKTVDPDMFVVRSPPFAANASWWLLLPSRRVTDYGGVVFSAVWHCCSPCSNITSVCAVDASWCMRTNLSSGNWSRSGCLVSCMALLSFP